MHIVCGRRRNGIVYPSMIHFLLLLLLLFCNTDVYMENSYSFLRNDVPAVSTSFS